MLLLSVSPGAELVLDPERLDVRQLRLSEGCVVARAESVLGDDLLPFGRVQEIEVGLSELRRAALRSHGIDDSYGWRRLDAERRIDDVELVAKLGFQEFDLVLERDENVAHVALRECGR